MRTYLYLSMTPESLVASMLPPEEFGNYLAVGTRKSAHGHPLYFDLQQGFQSGDFDLKYAAEHCVPHPDGQPKHSVYLAVYRVLERIPLAALGSLWLASAKGKVLELKQTDALPEFSDRYYLYQELCPVHPLIASKLAPGKFTCFITNPTRPLTLPRICFVDLDLGEMAMDPEHGQPRELYYPDYYWHLHGCLLELQSYKHKHTKTIDRGHPQHFPYHCIRHGFYVGDQQGLLHYRFPSLGELEGKHSLWWRSVHH